MGRLCDRREVSPEIRFRRAVGQVADEEADSQGFPERPRDCISGVQHTCSYLRRDAWPPRPEGHRVCAELGPFHPVQRAVVASIAYPRLPVRIRALAGLGIMTANVVG